MDVRYDFSDVDDIIRKFKTDTVKAQMSAVGDEAVEYARENGDYHDCTGNLRASNKAVVDESGLELYNEADYASEVESRGYDVLSGAALFAEKRLKEIFE